MQSEVSTIEDLLGLTRSQRFPGGGGSGRFLVSMELGIGWTHGFDIKGTVHRTSEPFRFQNFLSLFVRKIKCFTKS